MMIVKQYLPLTIATLMTANAQVFAEPAHSFTYIEAGYWQQDDDGSELDGYGVSGSFLLGERVYIRANYIDGEFDKIDGQNLLPGASLEVEAYGLGVGGVGSLNDKTTVWAGLDWQRDKVEASRDELSASARADEFLFGGGVRYWALTMLEINGALQYAHLDLRDSDETEDDLKISLGLRFQPMDMFSIGLGVSRLMDLESDEFTLDARFQF